MEASHQLAAPCRTARSTSSRAKSADEDRFLALTDHLPAEAAEKAANVVGVQGLSPQFVLSEWANVVDAWQIADLGAYAAVPRMAEGRGFGAKQRESLWPVFARVREALAERRLMTSASLTAHEAGQAVKPYTHIIVDEAQDLGVPELRFLSALAPDNPDALFFAGDLGQRISSNRSPGKRSALTSAAAHSRSASTIAPRTRSASPPTGCCRLASAMSTASRTTGS
jgi:hypothetical protein